ncbi:Glutathione import ATP-binding protein GsiA [Serratia plymuthica]|uniref:ABC-type dipeptide transporter n=1 Tax=Serratia plymuthica TaxID=82996 RepID=A0A2X4UVB0_SERPL|nr:Glutathione import ATP-binding protein GsiA [Serratia plymuthica]
MGIDNRLLIADRLSVLLPAPQPVALVKEISFSMGQERLALVGESGSGKSLTARALMGLLPPPLQVRAQRLTLGGDELTQLNERQWNRLRGTKVAMVMQDPKHALNPTQPIGKQGGGAAVTAHSPGPGRTAGKGAGHAGGGRLA